MTTEERINYRVYPDGTVIHQDDFEEMDNGQPYDDYESLSIPACLEDHIIEMNIDIGTSMTGCSGSAKTNVELQMSLFSGPLSILLFG